jgi:hypothetical protein
MILLIVMRCSDTVGVRGKIMELGGSLVPVIPAAPAPIASV